MPLPTRRFIITTAVIFIMVCSGLIAQPSTLPKFEDYHTSETIKSKPAPAKPKSPDAKQFRTAIKKGAKEGPNFAGRYTIVTWGCGTACVMFAIVDARSGAVFMAPFTVSMGAHLNQEEDLIDYRPDSKLLVITGDLNEEEYGKYYYVWDKGQLTLLQRTEPNPVQEEE